MSIRFAESRYFLWFFFNLKIKINYFFYQLKGIDLIEAAISSVIGSNEALLNNVDMALNICAQEFLDYVSISLINS